MFEIAMYNNITVLFLMGVKPKAIYIKNKNIYEGLLDYFNLIWNAIE